MITGAGIVSAIGLNKQEALESLLLRRSGIGPVRYLQTAHTEFPVGEVKLSNSEIRSILGIADTAPTIRTALLGMLALKEALADANMAEQEMSEAAFISGTTVGGMDKSERYYLDFLATDNYNAYIATHDCGASSELIADHFGRFGFVATPSTACSSAANAIIVGANMIRSGMADIVVAGGSECLTRFHLNGFNSLMILDREPCRPFDAARAGLNLGEGAAYVVLERASSAMKRRVKPLARLDGYGNACDAFHQTASSPDGDGAYIAMQEALTDAGLAPQEIHYINAHGTSTHHNDLFETRAIKLAFKEHAKEMKINSTKSMIGHLLGAAGAIEFITCVKELQEGYLHQTAGLKEPDEECDLDYCMEPVKGDFTYALSNSLGFGGHNAAIVLKKWEE